MIACRRPEVSPCRFASASSDSETRASRSRRISRRPASRPPSTTSPRSRCASSSRAVRARRRRRARSASASDVIGICVPADEHVRAVVYGDDGLLAGVKPGAVIAIHSTILPATAIEIAEAARPLGVAVLDACVTGGAERAQAEADHLHRRRRRRGAREGAAGARVQLGEDHPRGRARRTAPSSSSASI